jgi:hypothetical protein
VVADRHAQAGAEPDHAQMTLLRPRLRLFWHGITACAAFLTPVFAVLYVMSVPGGDWPAVLALHGFVSLLVALAAARFFLTAIWVGPEGISERGYLFPRRNFTRDQVHSIVRARTFGHGSDIVEQLFVLGADGRRIVRMRGQFWTRADMDTVVDTLGVRVSVIDEIMTLRELAAEHPRLTYWFERY